MPSRSRSRSPRGRSPVSKKDGKKTKSKRSSSSKKNKKKNKKGVLPSIAYAVVFVALCAVPAAVFRGRDIAASTKPAADASWGLLPLPSFLSFFSDRFPLPANPLFLALCVFNGVNALIAVWELALFFFARRIQRQAARFESEFGFDNLPSPLFLFAPVTLRRALSLRHWSLVWSSYSQLDPSYADNKSFGFWVDSGNGMTTLLPSLLLNAAFVRDDAGLGALLGKSEWLAFLLQPRLLALIGACMYWQEMYGTFVYFSSYLYHRRFRGRSLSSRLIVLLSNGMWIVFPAVGLYGMWTVIESGNWDAFRT
jgi:hypothetical protein